jgi:hypothetical protein
MNLYKLLPAMALGAIVASCSEDPELPPMIVPEAANASLVNSNFLDVKTKYWSSDRNYIDTIGLTEDYQNVYVRARVTGTDAAGNIYKYLYLQDTEGNGIGVSIDASSINSTYHVGQEVILDMTGLNLGKYNGELLIGKPEWYASQSVWEAGRMDLSDFEAHAQLNGLPNEDKLVVTHTDIATIQAATSDNDVILWSNRYVQLDSVTISGSGSAYADGTTTYHNVTDSKGNTIVLPISSYATFAGDRVPSGKCSIRGVIVNKRRSNAAEWQLWITDTSYITFYDSDADNSGSDDDNTDVTPEEPATPTVDGLTSLSVDFEGLSATPDDWVNIATVGAKPWYTATYSDNTYAAVTGYKGTSTEGYDSWLITPAINVDGLAEKILTFQTQVGYSTNGDDTLKVYVLTSADPTTATATELTANVASDSGTASYSGFEDSGDVSLAAFSGVVYIGFRYQASSSQSKFRTYCLDNVIVK